MILKRFIDIVLSSILIIVLLPLILVIACLVKISSPGPILFVQARVGYAGELFLIHKFRTMYHSEKKGLLVTSIDDTRITSLGKILRAVKADELPQLFDVLIGNMSLVGPRPEVPEYVIYYPDIIKERIFLVKPGITDLSSIILIDEEHLLSKQVNSNKFYIEKLLPLKLEIALWYINNRDFWIDFYLIALTIKQIGFKILRNIPLISKIVE